MNANQKNNKRLWLIIAIPSIILLLPLIAMQFTNEVNWTVFDFIVAGLLLFGVSFLSELVLRHIKNRKHRIIAIAILLLILLLIWLELAVGIFGSPFAGV